jgi:anti-sigma regulatory factor (Ser/Thr protein kinase)
MPRTSGEEIRGFIINQVDAHPRDIAKLTAEEFGITRQAVQRHLAALVTDGSLTARGMTRDRVYAFNEQVYSLSLRLAENRDEDKVWRAHVEPLLGPLPDNVLRICHYGFTEIFNNAIDHSEGTMAFVAIVLSAKSVSIVIEDDGVGIFEKIRAKFDLDDHRRAVFELAKGKLTTDPRNHTGQGIFFTSRIFDRFAISADHLFYRHGEEDDWLIEVGPKETAGTLVRMVIDKGSTRSLKVLFDKYADLESDDYEFSKTHVPVALARYGRELLVSRSQAKRVLSRFDDFKVVLLDFEGVEAIGQAFADEIFRVFQDRHPEIRLFAVRMNKDVRKMVARAMASREG